MQLTAGRNGRTLRGMGKKEAYWKRVREGEDPNSLSMRTLWKEVRAEDISAEKNCKIANQAQDLLLRAGARV